MKLPVVSGKQVIINLVKICFKHKRTKGSHAVLRRNGLTIVVPLYEELSKGVVVTILFFLEKLGYTRDEAIKFLKIGKPRKVPCPLPLS